MIPEQTRICKEYLEIRLGQPLDYEQLKFHDMKDRLGIKDIDLYHNIAKSLGIHELKQIRKNLEYSLKVPNDEKTQWTVALIGENAIKFKQVYGREYKIL